MSGRVTWALVALVWFGILVLAHRAAVTAVAGMPGFVWFYGLGYLVFGVLLLGLVARWWWRGSPALWRPAMLSVGSLAAAGEIALAPAGAGVEPVDLWMAALLGLVVVALLARIVSPALSYRWLGVERRVQEPGA